MGVIIKGGTIVTADQTFEGDIYSENETITAIGNNLEVPSSTEVIDAQGCYVMPGGIDPQTHMQLPFMGTHAIDDFYTGTTAMMTGGTTMLIDFVIPPPNTRVMDSFNTWSEWALKSSGDYSFHVAITWWDESVKNDMTKLAADHGVNSFKHFMAYKGAIMADDEILSQSFNHIRDLGAMATVHAENGEMVAQMQQQLLQQGITGPEAHPLSRPPIVEGEAAHRAIRFAELAGIPLYVVHTSSAEAFQAVRDARLKGQLVFSEVLSQHLVLDDSVYLNKDWDTAAHYVMSPPFRPKGNQEELWKGLQSGMIQTTATDHCTFSTEQKRMGVNDFTKIPNGTGGLEDRLNILWHHGVNKGRITINEFVALTSTNAAKIFNIYPRKGAISEGADADIIVWDPTKTKTISAKTQHQVCDFNIFEGMEVKGVNRATLSRGMITYLDGDVRAQRGHGKYINRPCHSSYSQMCRKRYDLKTPSPISR